MDSDHHVFHHSHAGKKLRRLKGATQAETRDLMGFQTSDRCAVQNNVASVRGRNAAGHVEEAGLSCSIRPNDSHDLGPRKVDRHAAERKRAAKGQADVLQLQRIGHGVVSATAA